jgi:hypothetical protein
MPVSFEDAAAASKEVKELVGRLTRVVAVGVTKVASDFGVKVNLMEEPGPELRKQLPGSIRGIPIVVDVTGMPKAAI